MIRRGVIEFVQERFDGNHRAEVTLLTEPITIEDGSEYALFHIVYNPSGNQEIRATHYLDDDHNGATSLTLERVIELGDGNFHLGVMEFAKNHIPRPNSSPKFVCLDDM